MQIFLPKPGTKVTLTEEWNISDTIRRLPFKNCNSAFYTKGKNFKQCYLGLVYSGGHSNLRMSKITMGMAHSGNQAKVWEDLDEMMKKDASNGTYDIKKIVLPIGTEVEMRSFSIRSIPYSGHYMIAFNFEGKEVVAQADIELLQTMHFKNETL